MKRNLKLWYQEPAEKWTDSLPLGNGRIGIMVFGGITQERIGLNEDTLWSGYPCDKNNSNAAAYLEQARALCMERKYAEAQDLIEKKMEGDFTESYMPMGDLRFHFPDIEEREVCNYRRELDLEQAVSTTTYEHRGTCYRRTVFVSYPAQMMVMKLTADRGKAVSFEVEFDSQLRNTMAVSEGCLILEGECPSHVEPSYLASEHPVVYETEAAKRGIRFVAMLQPVVSGGTVVEKEHALFIKNADSVELRLVVRSSFNGFDRSPFLEGKDYKGNAYRDLNNQKDKSYEQILLEHQTDFGKYFNRVSFSIGKEESESESISKTASKSESESISEGKSDNKSKSENESISESKGERESISERESKSKSKSENERENIIEIDSKSKSESEREGEEEDLPTDERLVRFRNGEMDSHLYELIFQYGRYLLISCSREGTQPANLQGIWNEELRAPWSSNYTLNINTEMNYWLAEICNLSEFHNPLFDFIGDLRVTGAKTAKLHYGAKGVTVHHNSDLWRLSNPVGRSTHGSVGYAYWSLAFGWLCQHLYEHYEYTNDKEFLAKKAYPAIKDAALFYLDVLTEDRNHHLILSPSTSPENAFLYQGEACRLAETTTMTTAIIWEVFSNVIKCCEILGTDSEFAAIILEKRSHLKPYEIGKQGALMEWYQDYEDAELTHRHISHLYPLYPGHEITMEDTPELAKACECSLNRRGDDGTGWSIGWKMNAWVTLKDGNRAEKLLRRQLRYVDTDETNYSNGGGTYKNLFDAHPPFQIDGNFAASAGIARMFLQSHGDRIELLPALPKGWKDCCMKGLCAIGNLVVDLYVQDGNLTKAVFHAGSSLQHPVSVFYQGKCNYLLLEEGEDYVMELVS